MKLRFLGGRHQGRIIELKSDGFTIGRGPDNDLVLDEDGVSRHHCRFHESGGRWVVEDLQSTNGVRVNGDRISGSHPLAPGDRLGLHRQLFLFTDGSDIVDIDELEREHGLGDAAVAKSAAAPTDGKAGAESAKGAADAGAANEPEAATLRKPSMTSVIGTAEAGAEPLPIPWGRLVLLAALVVIVALIALNTFRATGPDAAPAAAADKPATAVAETDATDATRVSELDRLMAEEAASTRDPSVIDVAYTPAAEPPTEPPAVAGAEAPVEPRPEAAENRAPPANVLLVVSEPPGATFSIDGQAIGVTPSIVRDLPEGRRTIALHAPGYEELVRQIHLPDALPTRPYVLRQAPGTLLLQSTPPGATVWSGTQILGQTPLLLATLGEGEHELRLALPGCEPQRKTVTISAIRAETLTVALAPMTGTLEVTTQPPGCRVLVDGTFKAVSAPGTVAGGPSRPVVVAGLPEGERQVRIEHPNGTVRSGQVTIVRGESVQLPVRLWVIDTRLVLRDGTVKHGMLTERNSYGDVVLAEGTRRLERYLSPQIEQIVTLSPSEAQEAMRSVGEGGAGRDADTGFSDVQTVARAPSAPAAPRAEAPAVPDRRGESRFTPATLQALLDRTERAELNRRYLNQPIVMTGVPTAAVRDALGVRVDFGPRVRAFFQRADFEPVEEQVRAAVDGKTAVTVSGIVLGFGDDGLVMRDCKLDRP